MTDLGDGSGALPGTAWSLLATTSDGVARPVPDEARDPGLAVEPVGGATDDRPEAGAQVRARLLVRTGCNSGSALVSLRAGAAPGSTLLRVGPVLTTRMAGPPEVAALEVHVLAVLRDEVTAVVAGDRLTLVREDLGLLLVRR